MLVVYPRTGRDGAKEVSQLAGLATYWQCGSVWSCLSPFLRCPGLALETDDDRSRPLAPSTTRWLPYHSAEKPSR